MKWNRQSVPKRRHINFRRRGITQKKAYNIQYTAKVWNQGRVLPANFFDFNNTLEFLTLAWDFEPGSALIVHYTTKDVCVAIFSYIIYVTSVIHTFCHIQLFRPDLYSTVQQPGFHVRAEAETISLDNKFQKFFCTCDEYVINLFVCIYEVRKGT